MIFYFSGTGNSEWVAKNVALKLGDKAADICSLRDVPATEGEEYIGLVFPVYAWGPAQPMYDFAASLQRTAAFTFGICTCGADAGLTMISCLHGLSWTAPIRLLCLATTL